MVSDVSVVGVARDRLVGGLSAPMYLLTVSLWMPILRQSLAIALGFLTPSEYRRNMDRNLSSAVV